MDKDLEKIIDALQAEIKDLYEQQERTTRIHMVTSLCYGASIVLLSLAQILA